MISSYRRVTVVKTGPKNPDFTGVIGHFAVKSTDLTSIFYTDFSVIKSHFSTVMKTVIFIFYVENVAAKSQKRRKTEAGGGSNFLKSEYSNEFVGCPRLIC